MFSITIQPIYSLSEREGAASHMQVTVYLSKIEKSSYCHKLVPHPMLVC